MPLAIIFVIIFLLKILDIPPVGNWSWIWVLTPFALLILWWNVEYFHQENDHKNNGERHD